MRERIKRVRIALDLSQKKFGDSIGVSRDVICNIENRRAQPSQSIIDSIINTHGVNDIWLYTGTGAMFRRADDLVNALSNVIAIFDNLSPSFQDYALNEIQNLYNEQN
jgi:DNA-binding XRE family transcriptional regulator